MFDYLFSPEFMPFTFSLALLLGLTVLELAALLIGMSFLGDSADADVDADLDGIEGASGGLEAPDLGDLDLDGVDFDGADLEGLDLAEIDGIEAGDAAAPAVAAAGPSAWLGLGKMPMLIWLAVMLFSFGLSGTSLQFGLRNLLGWSLPPMLASLPAFAFALWFTRGFGAAFARLLPQVESEALSVRSLGRRRGIVSQGTAAQGRPAEVRVMDGYGNAHYLRAEPLQRDEQITQGTEVLVIRDRRQDKYVLIPLSE